MVSEYLGEAGVVFDQENALGHASLKPPSGSRTVCTVCVAELRRKLPPLT
jgi:hypothetical protein